MVQKTKMFQKAEAAKEIAIIVGVLFWIPALTLGAILLLF